MEKELFLADLSSIGCSWGDKSTAIQFFQDILDKGYDLYVIADRWNNESKGVYFDDKKKEYVNNGKKDAYLFNPEIHPIDFFNNLIKTTYPGTYLYNSTHQIPQYNDSISWDFRYGTEWRKHGFVSKQKKYVLNPKLVNENYKKVEQELSRTKNIVLYATWDDQKLFEKNDDRTRGIAIYPREFENMLGFVKHIDAFCRKNPGCRIVLVSKKAVDWTSILSSDYYDLRNFETQGICFSQLISLLQDNSFITIGSACSFAIWLSIIPDTIHCVFGYNNCSEITRTVSYLRMAEKFITNYFGVRVRLRRKPLYVLKGFLREKSAKNKICYYLFLLSSPSLLVKRLFSKFS